MSNRRPLMPKSTAVWLVENTSLTFEQIAEFCGMHLLEVKGIADGDVAAGIKGMDPIATGQLTREEIKRGEADPNYRLKLAEPKIDIPQVKTKRGPRYTPVSRRQDRPNAVLWLLRNHPELRDSQIMRLVGTTKPTIQSIRDRTHWNIANIQPVDPVALGLCKQSELDAAVAKAVAKAKAEEVMSDSERMRLVSTEQSLQMEPEPRLPSAIAGLESFSLTGNRDGEESGREAPSRENAKAEAERLFNLDDAGPEEDEEGESRG